MIWIERAERSAARGDARSGFELDQALGEISYTASRIDKDHPVHHKLQVVGARIDYAKGKKSAAYRALERLVNERTQVSDAYSVLALYLYRDEEHLRASQVLEDGLNTVPGPPAEMHYFLGLNLLQLKEYSAAATHAREAYKQGYPLTFLRNRLKTLGYWADDRAASADQSPSR